MPKCPVCKNKLSINIQAVNNDHIINVNSLDTTENLIRKALVKHWRWVTEGCPKKQYYYDPYYDCIEFLGDDIYRFHIQIHDSPMGDTWIKGKFRVKKYFCDIEILEQETVDR